MAKEKNVVSFGALGDGCALYATASQLFASTPKAASARGNYGKLIKVVGPLADSVKIATQARVVYNAIAKAGEEGISENALAASLVEAGLQTRQNPLRIFRFYRKMLVDGKYISCN